LADGARSVRELVIKTSIDASELQSTVDEVLTQSVRVMCLKSSAASSLRNQLATSNSQVVFDNDQHRAGIIANATSLIEAMKAAYARQEAMMAIWHCSGCYYGKH
jgi:hypothetical protein